MAIPNIKLFKKQYQSGREYTDKKLEEFLSSVLKDDGEDIRIEIDVNDVNKKSAVNNLLNLLSDTAVYALNNEETNNIIKPTCKVTAFSTHLNNEYRLKSDDKGYLVNQQWEITSFLRNSIYQKLNGIKVNHESPLSVMEQAALVQKFYSDFSNKIIWTNFFVSTKDGREGTEQASIILMLHSFDIMKELNTTTSVKGILGKVIKTDIGWGKNYLIDENRDSISYVPIICASKVTDIKDVFERFYKLVIKPYTIYAINYTSLKLGYKTSSEVINEYCIKHSN